MCYLNDRPPRGRAARCAPSYRVHPHVGGCVPFSLRPAISPCTTSLRPASCRAFRHWSCATLLSTPLFCAWNNQCVIFTLLFTTTSCVILSRATLPSPISLRASSSLVVLVSIFLPRTDFSRAKFSQVTSLCTSPYALQRGILPPTVLPV